MEALLDLSVEGLVAITPHSGMAVVGVTPEVAVDNFAILAALAGKAAEMATARITAGRAHELHRLAGAIDESDDVQAAAHRFHRALNSGAFAAPVGTFCDTPSGSCLAPTSSSSPGRSSAASANTPRSFTPSVAMTARRLVPSPKTTCSMPVNW